MGGVYDRILKRGRRLIYIRDRFILGKWAEINNHNTGNFKQIFSREGGDIELFITPVSNI